MEAFGKVAHQLIQLAYFSSTKFYWSPHVNLQTGFAEQQIMKIILFTYLEEHPEFHSMDS